MEREKMVEEMKLCADRAYYNWDNVPKNPVRKICEGLVDEGYCKVPEGAVVLTKEELESGITFNELVKSIVRKETAKEILQSVYNVCKERKTVQWDDLYFLALKYGVEVE